uniref:Uncharacterized protein n=1 Tax=Rangifer tarandus platyrhynchus TaxID=3082113 RepID=A0ACB0DR13_RANTA|nr:unnamed protein product [Rangifer tarandus platyrhynchus]
MAARSVLQNVMARHLFCFGFKVEVALHLGLDDSCDFIQKGRKKQSVQSKAAQAPLPNPESGHYTSRAMRQQSKRSQSWL